MTDDLLRVNDFWKTVGFLLALAVLLTPSFGATVDEFTYFRELNVTNPSTSTRVANMELMRLNLSAYNLTAAQADYNDTLIFSYNGSAWEELTSQVVNATLSGNKQTYHELIWLPNYDLAAAESNLTTYRLYYGNATMSRPTYTDVIDVNTVGDDSASSDANALHGYNATVDMDGGVLRILFLDNVTNVIDETNDGLAGTQDNTDGVLLLHNQIDDTCTLLYDGVLEALYICESDEHDNEDGDYDVNESVIFYSFTPNIISCNYRYDAAADNYTTFPAYIDEGVDGPWYFDDTSSVAADLFDVSTYGYATNDLTTAEELFFVWDEDYAWGTARARYGNGGALDYFILGQSGAGVEAIAPDVSDWDQWFVIDGAAGNLTSTGIEWESKFDNLVIPLAGAESTDFINFTWTPVPGYPNETMYFNATNSTDVNVTSWLWKWNGTNETGPGAVQNTTYTFNTTATYNVCINASNLAGSASSEVCYNVEVKSYPTANFTYTPSIIAVGTTVQFNDTSTDIDGDNLTFLYTFGDGTNSTTQNATNVYATPGTYNVTLNVTDENNNSDTYSENLTVVGIRVRVYDERSPATQLTFNITLSNTTVSYSASNQTVFTWNNTNGTIPTGPITIQITEYNGNYQTRFYYATYDDSNPVDLTAYLLHNTHGSWVYFIVRDTEGTDIENAQLTFRRSDISPPAWITVGQRLTDALGTASFFMDVAVSYQLDVSATGFALFSTTFSPIAGQTYLITLGNESAIENYRREDGLYFEILPALTSQLGNEDNITMILRDPDGRLGWYSFNITYGATQLFIQNVTGNPSGGDISINVSDYLANITRPDVPIYATAQFFLNNSTGPEIWIKTYFWRNWTFQQTGLSAGMAFLGGWNPVGVLDVGGLAPDAAMWIIGLGVSLMIAVSASVNLGFGGGIIGILAAGLLTYYGWLHPALFVFAALLAAVVFLTLRWN